MIELLPTITPGIKETFIPTFTFSPKIAPKRFKPVFIFFLLTVAFISSLSHLTLAVTIPAPILQPFPKIESPKYPE